VKRRSGFRVPGWDVQQSINDLEYAETQTLQNDCDRIRKKILNLIKYLKTRKIANNKPQ